MKNINLEKNSITDTNKTQEGLLHSCFLEGEKYSELKTELMNKGYNFLEHGAVLARFGEKGFTGDGSSLFTVASEENNNKLLKLAYREFSHETFGDSPKTYPENALKLQDLPTPLFVVNQTDSYFDIEENLKLTNGDILEYLKEYANFSFIDGVLHQHRAYGENNQKKEELGDFKINSIKELISAIKNLK